MKQTRNKRTVQQEIRRRTIIAFSVFFICIGLAYIVWIRLYHQPTKSEDVQPTLRKGLQLNEKIFSLIYSRKHQAKTFEKSQAVKDVRVNGDAGMGGTLDTATWRMKLVRKPGDTLL